MLSIRLSKVLEMIDSDKKLADIGCDHGYLAKEAINKGVSFVQLVDNKEMPLNVARKNLKDDEKKATIVYTLADGLSAINENINVVAICGMGSELISSIITDNLDVVKKMDYLVLEANSKNHILRETLSDNKLEIIDEDIVFDKGKYYEIIKARYNPKISALTATEIYFGPLLLKERSKTFLNYLNNKLENLNKILNQLDINDEKYQILNKERIEIMEVLNETN